MDKLTHVDFYGTGGGCVIYTALFNNEVWNAPDFESVASYDIPCEEVDEDFCNNDVPYEAHYKYTSIPYPTWRDVLNSIKKDKPECADYVERCIKGYCKWRGCSISDRLNPELQFDHVSYENTGGNTMCYSALYKKKYWLFGNEDFINAYTVDPLHTTDSDGDMIDPNEYIITDATDFPTWKEVLDSIPDDQVLTCWNSRKAMMKSMREWHGKPLNILRVNEE